MSTVRARGHRHREGDEASRQQSAHASDILFN